MKLKKLAPTKLNHFLAILSFLGFIGIFLSYSFGINWLANQGDALFLLIAGLGLLVVGKVFTINKWARDGFQQNEYVQILSLVIGLSSFVIGLLIAFGVGIPTRFEGYVGIVALLPALFILFDYLKKR